MSPRQQRFVDEYLIDLNAAAAATRAGYSPAAATEQGHRLLTYAHVAEAVAAGQAERAKRLAVTADRVIEEYAKIAFANMADYAAVGPALETLTPNQTAAIAEVSQTANGAVRIKLHDKKSALDSLAKHLGLFIDRHELTGRDGTPLQPPEDPVLLAKRVAFILAQADAHQNDSETR